MTTSIETLNDLMLLSLKKNGKKIKFIKTFSIIKGVLWVSYELMCNKKCIAYYSVSDFHGSEELALEHLMFQLLN